MTVTVFALALFLLLRPAGLVGSKVAAAWQNRAVSETVRSQWQELVEAGLPFGKGVPSVVVFGDYSCRYCAMLHDTLQAIAARDTSFTYSYFYASGSGATDYGTWPICAADQDAGEAVHDFLYRNSGEIEISYSAMKNLGIPDTAAFARCTEDDETATILAEQVRWAERLVIAGTPTAFTKSGRKILGVRPASLFVH